VFTGYLLTGKNNFDPSLPEIKKLQVGVGKIGCQCKRFASIPLENSDKLIRA